MSYRPSDLKTARNPLNDRLAAELVGGAIDVTESYSESAEYWREKGPDAFLSYFEGCRDGCASVFNRISQRLTANVDLSIAESEVLKALQDEVRHWKNKSVKANQRLDNAFRDIRALRARAEEAENGQPILQGL